MKTQTKRKLRIPLTLAIFLVISPVLKVDPTPKHPVISLDLRGLKPLIAQENGWGFVRQSADWARGNSNVVDSLLNSLNQNGFMSWPTGTHTVLNAAMGVNTFHVRIDINQSYDIASSSYSGTKNYKHKLIFWEAEGGTKALEMFFNSTTSLDTTGVLLMYRLNSFDGVIFTNRDAVVESYIYKLNAAGERRQTYSWSAPLISGGQTGKGRVILQEMSGVLCFKSVITVNNTTLDSFCGSGTKYYSLAYGVKIAAPHQSTALFGLANGAVANTSVICGAMNPRKFGLFTEAGFISDGNEADGIPADYPTSTAVTVLFTEVGTSGSGDGDDTRQTIIDGLSTNVQFRDSDVVPGD